MKQETVMEKLEDIEKELKDIKLSMLSNYKPKKAVSFRGIAKTKLNEKDLDISIRKAQKIIFSHEEV